MNCEYCSKDIKTEYNLLRHQKVCHLNPANLRLCLVCSEPIKNVHVKEQVTCSYSCSNKRFRSGPANGNWNEDRYITTCFHYHKKECVICGESLVVEVHHLDEDHDNNDPVNLIPLCPTHHRYWHSRHKHIVEDKIYAYIKDWSG